MDKRVQKTKKAIRHAFMELLGEKEIEKLKMKEIAERASVDRKTLYNYYENIEDILEEVENELIEKFDSAINAWEFDTVEHTMSAFTAFNEHLKENLERYTLLMNVLKGSFLVSKTVNFLKEKIRSVLDSTDVSKEKIHLATEFITHGMFAAYRIWFDSDRTFPLETFTAEVEKLVIGGTGAYFKE